MRRFLRAVFFLPFAASPLVYAQEHALDTLTVIGTRTLADGQVSTSVDTGLLGDVNVFDLPFSGQSYTDQLILDQQARTLTEVLDNNPAVRTEGNTFSDGEQQNIRGFPVGTGYLFNGISGLMTSRHPAIQGLQRVDVFLGPNALLNNGGDYNVGGTLDLIPKRAGDAPLNRITAGYVSDSDFSLAGDVGRRFGDANQFGVRVNVVGQKGDTPIENQNERYGAFSVGLDYKNDRLKGSLDVVAASYRLLGLGANFTVLPDLPVPGAPAADSNVFDESSRYTERSVIALGKIAYRLAENLEVSAAYGYSNHNETYRGATYGTINSAAGDLSTNAGFYDDRAKFDALQFQVRYLLNTGPIQHQLTAAFDSAVNYYGNQYVFGNSIDTNLYDPVPLAPLVVDAQGDTRPAFSSKSERRSGALADVATMFDGRLILIAGGRYQAMLDTNWDPATNIEQSRYDNHAVTPAVAVTVKVTPTLSIYGNYIEALQPGPQAPDGSVNAGQIFPPSVANQKEIGAKYDLGTAGVTAALFMIRQPGSYTNPVTNVFGLNGDVINKGLEISTFGELVHGVRLLGGASYYQPTQEGTPAGATDGKRPQGIPHVLANIAGEYDLPGIANLTLTSKLIFTSREYVDLENTQSIPSWTRFDVGARYGFRLRERPITTRLAVENVADKGYWQDATGGRLHPGIPRTVRLSVTADF